MEYYGQFVDIEKVHFDDIYCDKIFHGTRRLAIGA